MAIMASLRTQPGNVGLSPLEAMEYHTGALEIIEAMAISDVRLSLLKYQCYAFFFILRPHIATSLEGFLRGGNHPQMTLFQFGEVLLYIYP